MVALSHETARELGHAPPPDSEDARKPFVEVSGRKGLGVKADDLIDTLIDKAAGEVAKRNPEFSAADTRARGRHAGGRRRALLHDQVLARQGDRVRSRRGAQLRGRERALHPVRGGARQQHPAEAGSSASRLDEAGARGRRSTASRRSSSTATTASHEVWALVLEAARLDEVVEQVVRTLEFSVLAKYAFSLAQAFNAFYHRAPILDRGARRRPPLARRRGDLRPHPAHARARPDGHRGAGADVSR